MLLFSFKKKKKGKLFPSQNENKKLYFGLEKSESVSHLVISNSLELYGLQRQAPLSMELSMQEYWSGELFPSPEDLLDPGTEPKYLTL